MSEGGERVDCGGYADCWDLSRSGYGMHIRRWVGGRWMILKACVKGKDGTGLTKERNKKLTPVFFLYCENMSRTRKTCPRGKHDMSCHVTYNENKPIGR